MVKVQKSMRALPLMLLRWAVILIAIIVTLYAVAESWQAVGLFICGLIFKGFFSNNVYDPIFKDQSAQGWAWGELKKWATRKQPTYKLDI